MDSLWNINLLIACQLFSWGVPGVCRSPILHLGEMGELGWEEHRVVSNHSQSPVSHPHDSVDMDCKTNEEHRIRRASLWIENDYFNVDEEDDLSLVEEQQAEIPFPFFGGSSSEIPLLSFQKSGMGCERAFVSQTFFLGAESGTKNNNIVEFLENRRYAVPETAAGA
ncbi:MAG: hypothetical protein ACRCYZ_02905 [Alphaproteobacteria bacterium]